MFAQNSTNDKNIIEVFLSKYGWYPVFGVPCPWVSPIFAQNASMIYNIQTKFK